MPVAGPPQGNGEGCRHHELEKRAAEQGERLTIEAEEQVPGFMDRQVQAIEPPVVAGVPKAPVTVDRQKRGQYQAPAARGDRVAASLQISPQYDDSACPAALPVALCSRALHCASRANRAWLIHQ